MEAGGEHTLVFPALLYGAPIQTDIILGYPWLKGAHLAVVPIDHAMVWLAGSQLVWVDGYQSTQPRQLSRHPTSLLHHIPTVGLRASGWECDEGPEEETEKDCWSQGEMPEHLVEEITMLEGWQMEYEDSEGHSQPLSREELCEVATWFTQPGLEVCGVIQGVEPLEEAEVVRRREAIMRDYEGTVFSETTGTQQSEVHWGTVKSTCNQVPFPGSNDPSHWWENAGMPLSPSSKTFSGRGRWRRG